MLWLLRASNTWTCRRRRIESGMQCRPRGNSASPGVRANGYEPERTLIMYAFEYQRAKSVADAAAALSKSGGKALAGGQSLVGAMKLRLANPGTVVDLSGIGELKGIKKEGDAIVIGAMTTHAEVASSSAVKQAIPALAALAEGIGDRQVRNRGTLGGALANNDPAADYRAHLVSVLAGRAMAAMS